MQVGNDAEAVSLDKLLKSLLPFVCEVTGAPTGWIFLKTDDQEFAVAAAYGLPDALAADDWGALRYQPCRCQQRVMEGEWARPTNLVPCQRMEFVYGRRHALCRHISIPLQRDGELLGLLNLAYPAHRPPFSPAEMRLFDVVGEAVAAAVHKASRRGPGTAAVVGKQIPTALPAAGRLQQPPGPFPATALIHELSGGPRDPLTGLLNQAGFEQELKKQAVNAALNDAPWALLHLDLDHFHDVNESLGNRAGDQWLKRFAALLAESSPPTGITGRLGGDKFGIVLPGGGVDEALHLAQEVLRRMDRHMAEGGGAQAIIKPTASIGVVVYPDHGITVKDLMTKADLAMYEAKYEGGNRVVLYSADVQGGEEIAARLAWTRRIREALRQDRLRLFWQPIYSLDDRQVALYELLLRLEEPCGAIIEPNVFLPHVNKSNLMLEIDLWVVRQALNLLAKAGNRAPLKLAVNLAGRSFTDQHFMAVVRDELRRSQVDPTRLMFEITEQAAIDDIANARRHIMAMQDLGCRLALDDFGTGFAGFNLLKRLPVEFVKIDGSFIHDLSQSAVDQRLVKVMVEAIHALGKKTVAEFIQDPASLAILRGHGVKYGQGNYFGSPAPIPPAPAPEGRPSL
ncbi:MAG TPA: EAL domain-containing protein [Sphingobacteriaceae bacterium]|nr:EAL domain-containing protein [Sphingobacteriaceae bacterium]